MTMKAAGYKCPYCGYEDGEFDIIRIPKDDDGHILALDLECPECHYEWREPH